MPRAGSLFSLWIGMRLGFQEDVHVLSGSSARPSGHTSSIYLNRQSLPISLQQRGSSAPVPQLDELVPTKVRAWCLAHVSVQQKTAVLPASSLSSLVLLLINYYLVFHYYYHQLYLQNPLLIVSIILKIHISQEERTCFFPLFEQL